MEAETRNKRLWAWSLLLLPLATGCSWHHHLMSFHRDTPSLPPLGDISDSYWQQQESGAEADDFVVHQHEFHADSARLNEGGRNHLIQIATRLRAGEHYPIIVEASVTGEGEGEDSYPVHPDPDLDRKRREIVIRSLKALGIEEPEDLVVVAPAFAQPGRGGATVGGGFGGPGLYGGGFGGGSFGPFSGFGVPSGAIGGGIGLGGGGNLGR